MTNLNMKKFKLGFGPMSREIIEILASYTKEHNYPLMIIASRNQVDFDSGYVCTTEELMKIVEPYRNENLLICRDHCGPGFSDRDKLNPFFMNLSNCKLTIKNDIENGIDLIHIDVSRIAENQLDHATDLIDYTLLQKADMMLEFGSEDNTGVDLNSSIARIDEQLVFLAKYKDNVKFFVTQTGSLTKDGQVGTFNVEKNRQVAHQIHNSNFLFKEHNADYFTLNDILYRKQAGVDSLNIAPQLGKIQTDLLKEMSPDFLWERFANLVYSKDYWKRWVKPGITDKNIATSVSGHYMFNSDEYRAIMTAIDEDEFKQKLKERIESLINLYRNFDTELETTETTAVIDNPVLQKEEELDFEALLAKRLEELRKRDPFIYR